MTAMDDAVDEGSDRRGPDTIVCPGCLTPQPEGAHFCVKCGAPISAFSSVGPFERIFAQGHALRRSTSGPTSRLVVIGMWLLLLPQILFFVTLGRSGPGLLYCLGLAGVYGALLYRVTMNYRRQMAPRAGAPEESDGSGQTDSGSS